MYRKHSIQQQDCLICFEPLLKSESIVHYLIPLPICIHCLNKFEKINRTLTFYHHPLTILYSYNSFFRSLLFQYKGLYDYALKDTFLCFNRSELKDKYKNYIIVVAPSSDEDNQKRGFAPMDSIAQTFSSHVFTGLYKQEKYKQSYLAYEERKKVNKKIGIIHGEELTGKKVLLFDDVITSGSTLKRCLELVESYHPLKIELLVLATKREGDFSFS